MDYAVFRDISTIVGVGIAAVSLAVSAFNSRATARANRARLWLDLRKQFTEHNEVHRKLRPGGEWAEPGGGPRSAHDWSEVENYMTLFEHCESMLREKMIDTTTFNEVYKYRLVNIVA